MSAAVVTAYVPIPGHPRSEAEYEVLQRKLTDLPIRMLPIHAELGDCWLQQYLTGRSMMEQRGLRPLSPPLRHSEGDNPEKNSLAYLIVQAQKAEWLALALEAAPDADPLVWIDYGIFHLPDLKDQDVVDFMQRVEGEQLIVIPGCWDRDTIAYSDDYPMWRFCGGLIVMPRQWAWRFFEAMQAEYIRWIEEKNLVTWDVNTLMRVEQRCPGLPIWHYKADHTASMFRNYQPTNSNYQPVDSVLVN